MPIMLKSAILLLHQHPLNGVDQHYRACEGEDDPNDQGDRQVGKYNAQPLPHASLHSLVQLAASDVPFVICPSPRTKKATQGRCTGLDGLP